MCIRDRPKGEFHNGHNVIAFIGSYDQATHTFTRENVQLMDIAGPHAVFMHCLPAFHDHKTTVGKEMGERFEMCIRDRPC